MKKKRLIRSFDLLKRYKKNLMMIKFCNKKTKSKQVKTKQSKEM